MQGFRRNKGKVKGPQEKKSEANYSGQNRKRGKHIGKRSKNKNCFNCSKPGHFARDCIEPKVMFTHNSHSNIYVSSCLMLAEIVLFWTVDSAKTNHVVRDRTSFVEFR